MRRPIARQPASWASSRDNCNLRCGLVKREAFGNLTKKQQDAVEATWREYHDNPKLTWQRRSTRLRNWSGLTKMNDLIELMKKAGVPVTRESYIEMAWAKPLPQWTAELEMELPTELQDWSLFETQNAESWYSRIKAARREPAPARRARQVDGCRRR
jgi:hypothetical protein